MCSGHEFYRFREFQDHPTFFSYKNLGFLFKGEVPEDSDKGYRTELFKDSIFFKNLYKIQFCLYENVMPIFEEISIQRIKEKYVKNPESKKSWEKNKKTFSLLKNNLLNR